MSAVIFKPAFDVCLDFIGRHAGIHPVEHFFEKSLQTGRHVGKYVPNFVRRKIRDLSEFFKRRRLHFISHGCLSWFHAAFSFLPRSTSPTICLLRSAWYLAFASCQAFQSISTYEP